MPELPEVETVKNGLSPHLIEQTIAAVIVREHRLRWPIANDIEQQLKQHRVIALRRRSKYLLIDFEHGSLIIHLGMSGKLTVCHSDTALKKHDHVDIICENGVIIRYNDPRRFGAILWSKQPNKHPRLAKLGPEPLSRAFNGHALHKRCSKSQRSIKGVIMDASVVVGVGNIYANEALFHSGIHPCTEAQQLLPEQLTTLCQHIKSTLRRAIKAGGTTLKDFTNSDGKPGYFQQKLWVYGRTDQPCHRCQSPIQRITQHQRSSFFCPQCQTKQ